MFWKLAAFLFAGTAAPNMVYPLRLSYYQSLGTTETVNLLRCVLENRSSVRVVTGKWLLEN